MKPVINLYALLAGIGGIALSLSLFLRITPCAVYHVLGVPCPACGLTRSFIHLVQGDIAQSIWYHPLFWLVVLLPWITHKKIPLKRQNFLWITVLVLFTGVWVVRMVLYFPGDAPLNFNEASLLGRLIPSISRYVY